MTQLVRRILGHRWVIGACVLIAVVGVVALEWGHQTTYTASARLVLDTQDPTTRQEAAAIADTAKAIATSPGQVAEALRKAGVRGLDPAKVADRDVTVTSVGSSGLLELSVKAETPMRAAAVANALANAVIHTRLSSTRGVARGVLADLDKRLADLRSQISRADARIAALEARSGAALNARRDAAVRARQALSTQQSTLESERVSLLTAAAAKPRPAVVSAASPPAHGDPSDVAVHVVLAVLLGLILGIGLAALLEIVRPTVVGADAVAREFDAPLLGTLPSTPDREAALGDLVRIKSRLALALGGTRIPNVSLLGAGPEIDLRPLAARLEAAGTQSRVAAVVPVGGTSAVVAPADDAGTPEHGSGPIRIRAGAGGGMPSANGAPFGGVVVVAPSSMSMTDVVETTELLRVNASPVIGVIAYDRPRRSSEAGGEA